MLKAKPKGSRGVWFAEMDGVQIPCVHWRHTSGDERSPVGTYNDHAGRPTGDQPIRFVRAIEQGRRVILTRSGGDLSRKEYLALYSVDNVEVDERGLRFRFVEKFG